MSFRKTTNALEWEACPSCKASWDGGSILETFVAKRNVGELYYKDKSDEDLIAMVRESYGDASRRRNRSIGIEIQGGYDGILYVQCPDCKATFHRFTGEKLDGPFEAPGGFGEEPSPGKT